jgi:predicted ribosome quality control (RQC) complex YloA/Tae2 family protein
MRVEAEDDERLLRFRFRRVRGRVRSVQVIVELLTNQWNALLVEGREEWIRHILWTRQSEDRTLQVGQPYRAPKASMRRGVDRPLTEEEWNEIRNPRGIEDCPGSVIERFFLDAVAFSSPLNLPALLDTEAPQGKEGAAGIDGNRSAQRRGYDLWLRLRTLESPEPCILETTRGKQPYPFVLNDFKYDPFPTILEAIREASREETATEPSHARVLNRLDRALRTAEGKVKAIEREMEIATSPEVLREQANLLLARLSEVEKGAPEVRLKGFHGEDLTLKLDPSLSPHENAEALYREASRQERVQKRLPPLLKRARAQVEELVLLREGLVGGEIAPEEAARRMPSGSVRTRTGKQTRTDRLPFRRFRSSGGLEIRVGRGPADNDTLTFRYSRPEDVWLHARGASGAHVVLRWAKEAAPPGKDLTEAAILAALHSRSKSAGVVPVEWTRRKYVRKPRKSPAGSVVLERSQTLFVQPDRGLLKRLASDD